MKKITVAEYAKLKGTSKAAVYKKIKRLNTTTEEINGREQILIIIDEDQGKPENNPNSTQVSTDNKPNSTKLNPDIQPNSTPISTPQIQPNSTQKPEDNIIELLKKQIQEKDKQIEEKDKQIEHLQTAADEKDKQLKEQFDKFAELLYRQQQLEAISQHKLLADGQEPPLQEETPEEQDHEQKQKKGFFSRIFKRNREER